MARLQRQRFAETSDVRITGRGRVEVVDMGDRLVGRYTWEPGWRWSIDVKPIAGTEWCQSHHVSYAVSGRARVVMADGIELEVGPGEMYEVPPGHDAWTIGNEPFVSIDFEAMRGFALPPTEGQRRTLASILMTDIVDSTARAVEMGSADWQELIRRHNAICERAIDQHEGRLVKTTGDGVIGLFPSVEQAVRAASTISIGVQGLHIGVRAAVHTGEVEQTAADVRGVAVHMVARMMALGGANEIVVSSTVHDVLDGAGLEFEDFGVHELKGLPGKRQLYVLRPTKPQLRGYE